MRFAAFLIILGALALFGCSEDRTATAPAADTPINSVSARQSGEEITVTYSAQRNHDFATLWLRLSGPYVPIDTVMSGEPREFTFNFVDDFNGAFAPGDSIWHSVRIHWFDGPQDPENERYYAWYDVIATQPIP